MTCDETRGKSAAAATLVVLALTLGVGRLHAETTQCTVISSLSTTITVQGIYCLTSDFYLFLVSGHAITINTNNVVIDLNGHKIGNLGVGIGILVVGIYA